MTSDGWKCFVSCFLVYLLVVASRALVDFDTPWRRSMDGWIALHTTFVVSLTTNSSSNHPSLRLVLVDGLRGMVFHPHVIHSSFARIHAAVSTRQLTKEKV